jgi:hypothetical protein
VERVAAEFSKHAMFILKAPISGLLGATLFVAGARQEQLIFLKTKLLFLFLFIVAGARQEQLIAERSSCHNPAQGV